MSLEQREGAFEGVDEDGNPMLMFYRTQTEKKLVKHKPLRDVDWRDGNVKKISQSIQRRSAYAHQLAEAAPPGHVCGPCRAGHGPFASCRYAIVDGQLLFGGACTNCAWGGGNGRCDTYEGPLPKWLGDRLSAINPDAAALGRGVANDKKAAPRTPKGTGRAPAKRLRGAESSSKGSEEPSPKRKTRSSTRAKKGGVAAGPDYPHDLYNSVMDNRDVRSGDWPLVRAARRKVEELIDRLQWERNMITAVLATNGEEESPAASDEEEVDIFAGMTL
jgi:hypothetical protein